MPTFCQHQVSEARGGGYDSSNGIISDLFTSGEIQYSQGVKGESRGKVGKGRVIDVDAMSQSQLAKMGKVGEQSGDGLGGDGLTSGQVDFENGATILCNGGDGRVGGSDDAVEFESLELSAVLGDLDERVVGNV